MDSFYSDEEAENSESQKEDMKIYLSKLNKKIDILVEALKDAEGLIKQLRQGCGRQQLQAQENREEGRHRVTRRWAPDGPADGPSLLR